ncbi:thiol-disulfide oxidoreductase [Thioclava sp. SK-1]|uniref:DsbA family protein n=1 Tax=Thioclava sp. SK-1 TaxID=1889770 RepID=UPI0008240B51|nr:DsbA family protein [Thioclava sp. SK-1]OCX65761.1 thiol-disulfide oxidoreductase [Thioclava sp. SK-1]
MNRRSFLLGVSGAAIVAVTGGWIASRQSGVETGFVTPAAAQDAGVEPLPDIIQGDENAPVTLIEYASYTCPHCANWHKTIYPTLKSEYIDTGKVKFIHREVYFDKFGLWAGMIAQCGGDMKYYAVGGMIYDEQKSWIGDGQQATIAENLRKLGRKAGFSDEQLETCLNDQERAKRMVATFQKNASADEVDSTPTLVIDGKKYSNMPWDELKAVLDEQLAG